MDVPTQPKTIREFIDALHEGLICDRCGRYVGSLGEQRYLPPPYPIALDLIDDDEVRALVGFEWHMLGRMRGGNFTIRHPEIDGRCVSYREWIATDDDGDEEYEDEEG
ncbi:MAG TPA: hypothetical protein VFY79_05580 [Dehalococcoidia bacterium]|nr:hypothetical protein [Dehalococcoidia bacterium]